ncbi:MAG: NADP-specific glutamate dehydrogenase [Flavobacteriales bacterium]|nr:NADP-specific glutamate dehydrogenase [Flavobacteriales bacterium]
MSEISEVANKYQPQIDEFMSTIKDRLVSQPEFIQAVEEVAESVIPIIEENPKYKKAKILERLTEPDKVFMFRVSWVDDSGEVQVNRGFRIQMCGAIGPYKGGLRFHPSVNLSILKFLAFEQVFKNSLTTLPMGGGKGGSNFDPKGKSDTEIMNFCQAFMAKLCHHIGPQTDVPAGDIGVGSREIGYLFGQYKNIKNEFVGVLTGKGLEYGGSLIRPEATGYGAVYFAQNMLETKGDNLEGKTVVVSGSGNVAQYATEKVTQLGGKVVTLSDSAGYIHDPNGIDAEKLAYVMELKNGRRGRISEYADRYGCEFHAGKTPWEVPCEAAFPSATQNELNEEDAKKLLSNGCFVISEGANMPCTPKAITLFQEAKILYGPGKAANAGGVAVSGLEMTQNAQMLMWTSEEVDNKLQSIMKNIHENCVRHGKEGDYVNYVKGANIGGFLKVADAMLAQGII